MEERRKKWEWVFENYQKTPMDAFVLTFHLGAEEGADSFDEEIKESTLINSTNPHELYLKIYLEYLYFYLALLDRVAFNELGSENRKKFMDEFGMLVFIDAIKAFFTGDPAKIAQELMDNCNHALQYYLPYQNMLPPEGKMFSDEGLSRQLGKRIVKILNMNTDDILGKLTIDSKTYAPIAGFMVLVDLNEWIKGPVMSMGLKNYEPVNLIDDEKQKRISELIRSSSKNGD